jgi:hypothetical protein
MNGGAAEWSRISTGAVMTTVEEATTSAATAGVSCTAAELDSSDNANPRGTTRAATNAARIKTRYRFRMASTSLPATRPSSSDMPRSIPVFLPSGGRTLARAPRATERLFTS